MLCPCSIIAPQVLPSRQTSAPIAPHTQARVSPALLTRILGDRRTGA